MLMLIITSPEQQRNKSSYTSFQSRGPFCESQHEGPSHTSYWWFILWKWVRRSATGDIRPPSLPFMAAAFQPAEVETGNQQMIELIRFPSDICGLTSNRRSTALKCPQKSIMGSPISHLIWLMKSFLLERGTPRHLIIKTITENCRELWIFPLTLFSICVMTLNTVDLEVWYIPRRTVVKMLRKVYISNIRPNKTAAFYQLPAFLTFAAT